jgi:hypothetical protein
MTVELDDLEHHLDLTHKADFFSASGPEKADDLVALTRVRRKFDALDATVIAAFESTQEHRAQGHASPIGWLEHNTWSSNREATARRAASRMCKAMPAVHDVLVEGRISLDHVRALDRARRLLGDHWAIAERPLLAAAQDRRFDDFQRAVEYFLIRARAGDPEERERQQHEDRWATSSRTLGGCGYTESWLPPVGYTLYVTELHRIADHLLAQDRIEARERLGREPAADELARTAGQRLADAKVLMAERSAAFGDDDLPPSSVVLNVHGDAELVGALLDELHRALGPEVESFDVDDLPYPDASLHELEDGTPITAHTLVLAILTGAVRGILYDPQGVILRFGRARRLFTPDQRAALLAKYRRCAHPFGCSNTGKRLQSDHEPEWEDGGLTDTDDATPRCGAHNRFKHNTKGRPPPDGHQDRDQRRTPPRLGPRDTDDNSTSPCP